MKPLAAARFKLKILPLDKPKTPANLIRVERANYLQAKRDNGQFLDTTQKRELESYDAYRKARTEYDKKRTCILLEIAALQTAIADELDA